MSKFYSFKKAIAKVIAGTALFGLSFVATSNAQITIPRPWFEGFTSTDGIPTGFSTVGY